MIAENPPRCKHASITADKKYICMDNKGCDFQRWDADCRTLLFCCATHSSIRPAPPAPDDLPGYTTFREAYEVGYDNGKFDGASERERVLLNDTLDIFVCKTPHKLNEICKSHTCIVDYLKKSGQSKVGGELCWSMQELRRMRESLRSEQEKP